MGARFLILFSTTFEVNVLLCKLISGFVAAISSAYSALYIGFIIYSVVQRIYGELCPDSWDDVSRLIVYLMLISVFIQGILMFLSIDFVASDRLKTDS